MLGLAGAPLRRAGIAKMGPLLKPSQPARKRVPPSCRSALQRRPLITNERGERSVLRGGGRRRRFAHDAVLISKPRSSPRLVQSSLPLAKRSSVHPKTMIQRQAVALALVAATAVAWQPATRISSRATPLKMSEQVTDEEEAEIIANAQKIAKKKRSNLYNEEGVAYAPWMVRQVDEDAVAAARAMRGYEKRRERIALEEKQGTINILDAASSELTGLGLKAKVLSSA